MELIGKIKEIGSTEVYGSNGFRKRELVLTTDEQYPQHILIEFIQDKCDLLDACGISQQIKVNINLRGREWVNLEGVTKYFNTIQGWKIEVFSAVSAAASPPPVPPNDAFEPADNLTEEDTDDLPF